MIRKLTGAMVSHLFTMARAEEDSNYSIGGLLEFTETCTALVLSGGGSNGAWEAGVLYGLLHEGDPSLFTYDVVTGVSAGSINASGMSAFAKGDEVAATEHISEAWSKRTTADYYQSWDGGVVDGILFKQSAFDTTPMIAALKKVFQELGSFKRDIVISAVDINDGHIVTFTNENTDFDEFHHAVIASASVPGIFPPYKFKGHLLVDGMAAYNTNV